MHRKRPIVNKNEEIHLSIASEVKRIFTYPCCNDEISNIRVIFILNFIFAIYGTICLFQLVRNENYLYLNNLLLIPMLFIHIILEYLKFYIVSYGSSSINIRGFVTTLCISVIVSHVMSILFGADLMENIQGTFLFSCLLVTLAVIPLFFYSGKNCLLLILSQERTTTLAQKSELPVSYSVIAGAWLGAFTIPLDWNRPWQAWPIPCSIGSISGYIVGLIISCIRILHLGFTYKL